MTNPDDLRNLEGQNAVDSTGAKIGKIGQVYVDDQTSQPLWVTVSTGLFGTKESFAPLYGSQYTEDGNLQLAVTKDMVKDAPGVDADGAIDDSENEALYTYYQGHLGDAAQATTGQQDYAAGHAGDPYAADHASGTYATSQG